MLFILPNAVATSHAILSVHNSSQPCLVLSGTSQRTMGSFLTWAVSVSGTEAKLEYKHKATLLSCLLGFEDFEKGSHKHLMQVSVTMYASISFY